MLTLRTAYKKFITEMPFGDFRVKEQFLVPCKSISLHWCSRKSPRIIQILHVHTVVNTSKQPGTTSHSKQRNKTNQEEHRL